MDEIVTTLSQLTLAGTEIEQEQAVQKLIKIVCQLNENDDDDENDENHQNIIIHDAMNILLNHLKSSGENESLVTSVCQLIAELAKSESLREPLVTMSVVPHLLSHLSSKHIALATQACRALGNICFDNDKGRLAVDKEGGITVVLNVLSSLINSTQEGSNRLRVIVCGFLLNLTNNCEQLQERAVECQVLGLLNECITAHIEDEDLTNMALLTTGSITESEAGKEAAIKCGLLDTFKKLLDQNGNDHLNEIILDILTSLMESEPAKDVAADNGLCQSLVSIINCDTHGPEMVKMASDVLISVLVGDQSMEKLYKSGDGSLLAQSMEWLDSDKDTLKTLGTLAIGNFARRDAYCQHLVERGIVNKLINILKMTPSSESSFMLHHAVLSSLRNLAIPVANKPKLLDAGVMEVCLSLIHTDVMAVIFKLLGVVRMLIEGQEAAAVKLGQDRSFLERLSDWCGVEAHAGVKGEATRVMASLVKNSRSSVVIQNLIRADGVGHLVSMAMSEHLVMQNEAIMALTIICTTALGEASIALKEADLTETVITLLKDDKLPAEMMCNIFSLLQAISTAASPSVPTSCALLACAGLVPDVRSRLPFFFPSLPSLIFGLRLQGSNGTLRDEILTSSIVDIVRALSESHADVRVKDAARSTVYLLEQSMSCS